MRLKLAHRWWKRPMLSLSIDVGSFLMMLVMLGSSILGGRWSCLLRYLEIGGDLPRRFIDGDVTKEVSD